MSLVIRPATPEDIPAIARIHVLAKQKSYAVAVDNDYLQAFTFGEYEDIWTRYMAAADATQYLALYDDKPAGVISFGRLRTPPPGTSRIRPLYAAEIFGIHVHPDFWRKGVGSALINKAVDDLNEQKLKSLCLWVIDKNEAMKFYAALGGERIGKRQIEIGPSKVKELCYGWRDISVITSR